MNYFIYRFLDENSKILYIGKTVNLEKRIYTHFNSLGHLSEEQYKKVYRVEYIELDSKVDMDIAEIHLIAKHKPVFNKLSKYKNEIPSILIGEDLQWSWFEYIVQNYSVHVQKIPTKKVTWELSEELHKKLKIQAALEGRAMVDVISEVLRDYLEGLI